MDLSGLGSNALLLTFTDANTLLPPRITLAGHAVSLHDAGIEVQALNRKDTNVRLDLASLANAVQALEIDFPPALVVSVHDAALNPIPCRVEFLLSTIIAPSPQAVFLSDLAPKAARAHNGVKCDADYYGEPGFELGGHHFDRGIMTCPRADGPSEVVYDLTSSPSLRILKAVIGVEDQTGTLGSVTFEVYIDDGAGGWKLVYASDIIRGGGAVRAITVDLAKTRRLRLVCTDAADSHNSDHATWANVRLEPRGN